ELGDHSEKMESKMQVARWSRILYEDKQISVSIDASKSGSELRFINDTNSQPNVTFTPVKLTGKWHLLVYTTKDIEIGDEFLADFTVPYWKKCSEPSLVQ